MSKRLNILFIVLLMLSPLVFSVSVNENTESDSSAANDAKSAEPTTVQKNPVDEKSAQLAKLKRAARRKLMQRFFTEDGNSASIVIIPPTDYTRIQSPETLTKTIKKSIVSYDEKLDVSIAAFPFKSLTLEQFRDAGQKLKADIIFVTVIHPTNFDMYLYDRKIPKHIFAHSEPIAAASQAELSVEAAKYYLKLLTRRTLYRYIKDQYYELPRDESPTVLKSEIPRFIASTESLQSVNREAAATLLASVGLGAAVSKGGSSKWNSSIVSLEVGIRTFDKFYVEGAFQMFSYNAMMAGGGYLFSNKDSIFKVKTSLYLARTQATKTLDWDRENTLGSSANFVVPTITLLIPLLDVNFKVETQLFMGIGSSKYVFTILPGLTMMF